MDLPENIRRHIVDLAISGDLANCIEFSLATDEVIPTLLMFDFAIIDDLLSPELRAEIERDGVLLYAKV